MNRNSGEGITLLEAIETLSTIADLEIDPDIMIAETGDIVIGERRAIEWLNFQDEDQTLRAMRDIFALIYKYVRSVYSETEPKESERVVEGIKTIMVLVGEAAKKLDKYTTLFHWTHAHCFTELTEYKKLQQFYQNRIARQVDTRMLSRWILGLAKQQAPVTTVLKGRVDLGSDHVFVDLEAVKKDSEYELFFIRKEDGGRFFNPQLIRNITLVCDFGSVLTVPVEEVTLELPFRDWEDRRMCASARCIRDFVMPMLERFYRETMHYKNRELVSCLHQALMALFLSSNSENYLGKRLERKSCFDYFADFLYFLRAGLCTRDYQKMIAYPPKKDNRLAYAQLDLLHAMCYGLFIEMQGDQELIWGIQQLFEAAEKTLSDDHVEETHSTHQIWNKLAGDYTALSKMMRQYQNGPLLKILSMLQEGGTQYFDPIWEHDLPCQMFALFTEEQRILNVRMPCPIHQEFINKVSVNEEFKAFLRALKESPVIHRHLVINFQDKTAWKEHARAMAMEDLQKIKDFSDNISVVTLSKDCDFYHQNEPYASENHAAVFINSFVENLEGEGFGYYFPENVREHLSIGFFHGIIDAVHRVFFNERNVLTRDQRCDFIEITYLFIILKLIEIIKPESFTLMAKDGIDLASTANTFLFIFMKMLNHEDITQNDLDFLRMMQYAPSLMLRERVLIHDHFNRMVSALRVMENLCDEFGRNNFSTIVREAFGRYYETPILEAMVAPCRPT